MHDPELMQVLYTANYLLEELACLLFFELLLLDDVVEELAPTDVLHYQVQFLRGLDDLKKLDNVRVSDQFEDVDLPGYSLDVSLLGYLAFF